MNIRETASRANKLGLCVVPVREDGSKAPDVRSWTELQKRRPTDAELKTWFPAEPDRAGLGFICGLVSGGLELFEFDDPAAVVAFKQLADASGLGSMWRRLEFGYCEETPGGGVHWLYKVAEPLPNTKLASKPCEGCEKHERGQVHVLIETRGEGGFVVVAPSAGGVHATGRPYVLRAGGLETIPILSVEDRDELWALARSLDGMPRPVEVPPPKQGAPADGTRPGDVYGQQVSWAQVLEPHGWVRVHRRGGEEYWRRPGKKEGLSATTNYHDSDLLYVFSTSVPEFNPEEGYSKFRAYALLNHGGDFSAAAHALKAEGYGGYDPGPLVAAGGASQDASVAGGWAGETTAALPAATSGSENRDLEYVFRSVFELDHFVGRYVAYASQLCDAAHEYHEALAVMLLAACTPGVRATLSAWPNGLSTNLYVVLVGSSTRSRKSTAINIAKRVLMRVDDEAVFPDRFSTEAMLEQLAMRARKPAVWTPDEWGQVVENIERQPLLKAALMELYDSPPTYDYARHSKRIKGGGTVEDHDRVLDPHWNVIGATTEAVFDSLTSRSVESGFLPRFAFVYPQNLPPRMGLQEKPVHADDEQQRLVSYLRDLHTWSQATYGSSHVEFSAGTVDVIDEYMQEVEASGNTLLARLPAMAVKVAMLSALGEGVPAEARFVIEQRDAERGVALVRHWTEHAVRFGQDVGGFDALERRHEQRCIKAEAFVRGYPQGVSREEVFRYMRVPAKELDNLQQTLVDRGSVEVFQLQTDGRPKKMWRLSPWVESPKGLVGSVQDV